MRAQSDRTTYAAQYGSIYISVTVGLAGSCHFGAVGWWHAADRADRVRRAFCAAHLGEAGVCDPVRADSDVAPGLAAFYRAVRRRLEECDGVVVEAVAGRTTPVLPLPSR